MKLEYHLDSTLDLGNETIIIELRKATETLSKWMIDTRETAIRDALIKLGWSPPNRERSLDILDEANKELATKLRDVTAERDALRAQLQDERNKLCKEYEALDERTEAEIDRLASALQETRRFVGSYTVNQKLTPRADQLLKRIDAALAPTPNEKSEG